MTINQNTHPSFYALLVALIFMAVGPILLMFKNSFKLDVDIIGGTTGLLLAIPPIIFTLFASRQIITGMTVGAVKG